MYVEVSGRQTGKTTRLIESIITFLKNNPDKTALIVTPINSSRKEIQNMVHSKCGRPCEYRTITSHKMLPPKPNSTLKQFVDEFNCIDPNNLVIDMDAYYTGSGNISNDKVMDIWKCYKYSKQVIKPNLIIKRHDFK